MCRVDRLSQIIRILQLPDSKAGAKVVVADHIASLLKADNDPGVPAAEGKCLIMR